MPAPIASAVDSLDASAPGVPSEDGTAPDPALETALAPLRDVEVVARAGGLVTRLDAEEGDRVREGARLAQIDDREARATLAESEAALARAAASWERAQKLHDQKLLAEEGWIEARSGFEGARARRDRAALALEHCAVAAPIAGVVVQRRVQRGQTVKEGDALFRIADPTVLRAELLLPESMLGAVRRGQSVRLLPAAGGAAVPAHVTRVVPLVDPASGTFRVTIDLDNRRARLPAGMTVRVELDRPAIAGR